MNRLIIVGSPRIDGRSAHLADMLFESCIEEYPSEEVALVPVSTLDILGCQGCDACKQLATRISAAHQEAEEAPKRCVVEDDMTEVYELIDAADELIVVAPIYFAGPSAQLKALIDRFQPYFWTDARMQAKRPAVVHVVGEGGDPHGFDPLVAILRSALSCAGFSLDRVVNWVGKIDAEGEITEEAEEYSLALLGVDSLDSAQYSQSARDNAPAEAGKQVAAASETAKPVFRVVPSGSKKLSQNDHDSVSGESCAKRPSSGSGNRANQGGAKPSGSKKAGQNRGSQNKGGQGGKRRG